MSTTQVSIRLGVEGKAEVKRAFDEVGKAGQDAFRGVATSMDAAGAAADRAGAVACWLAGLAAARFGRQHQYCFCS